MFVSSIYNFGRSDIPNTICLFPIDEYVVSFPTRTKNLELYLVIITTEHRGDEFKMSKINDKKSVKALK